LGATGERTDLNRGHKATLLTCLDDGKP